LPTFEVAFHDDNLPHLLGLHYVSDDKFASGILRNIDSDRMTSKNIMNLFSSFCQI